MKKYKIAITGTFDVENYGDLMFPTLFEKAMRARGLEFEMYLFSPSETAPKPLDDLMTVFSYSEFEDIHNREHFDALIVGGGALIHTKNIMIKEPNSDVFTEYCNINSWLTPILYAVKNNIRVIFNVPQAPFEFPECVSEIINKTIKQVDYLSVRDDMSKKYLQNVIGEKQHISVYPDSICGISRYINKKDLKKIKDQVIPCKKRYAAIHFGKSLPDEAHEELVKMISVIQQNNYDVVLLPLGYTHGDDSVMSIIQEKCRNVFMPKRKLSIMEMTAILAHCDLYVGTSFHGSVVSMAYGATTISYNYYSPTIKNQDNYERFGVPDFLGNNYKETMQIVESFMNNKLKFEPKIRENVELVEEHFDNIYRYITDSKKLQKEPKKIIEEITLALGRIDEANSEKQQIDYEREQYKNEAEYYQAQYMNIINSRFWKKTKRIREIAAKIKR